MLANLLGRRSVAIRLYRQAIQVDPLNSSVHKNLGISLYYDGQQEEAKAALEKALELAPEMEFVHSLLGLVYLAQAHPDKAVAEMEKEKNPASHISGLALAYHALGRKTESEATLQQLIAKFPTDEPYLIAEVYAFRGETDRAFEWLDRAYTEHDTGLKEMKGDPLLKNLERDPRYADLLKKMRLPL